MAQTISEYNNKNNNMVEFKNEIDNEYYYFAFKINNKWNITNKCFLLNKNKDNLIKGQFISSSWFSKIIDFDDENITFAIVKIQNKNDKLLVLDMLIDNDIDERYCVLLKKIDMSKFDKLYFEYQNKHINNKSNVSSMIEMIDNNDNYSLSLKANVFENDKKVCLNISLPQFSYYCDK